jgi:VIT1/CCC1 family predicted Fe2+/Mn2+ transporter
VLAASLAITAVALGCGGMVVGRFTGRPVLSSGLRQVLLGALAVSITYGVGTLIGHHAG